MRDARIAVADLMLDGENPRHAPRQDQRQIIQALLSDDAPKLIELAKDIAEHGVSPIDQLMVVADESTGLFTVLEGNRRIAAIKLLVNPSLAAGHTSEAQFREIAANAVAELPVELRCAVAATRDEARHWLELRHTGENQGRGVIPWNTEASQRFAGRRGTQADKALAVIDAVEAAYPNNAELQDNVDAVRQKRLTTLGRLVGDPEVRGRLGIEISDGEVHTHYPVGDLEAVLERIFSDLAESLTVTQLKTKVHRREYIDSIVAELPSADRYLPEASSLKATPQRRKKRRSRKGGQKAATKHIFEDVELVNLGSRVATLLEELKRLDVDSFPNAAAVLTRSVLELAVHQVYQEKGWTLQGELKTRVRKCLHAVDPSDTHPQFQPVRAGLSDGTSVLAVATLHAYVHNPHFAPTPTEIRTIAARYAPFLSALDALV